MAGSTLLRVTFANFGCSSMLVGGAMLLWPVPFWALFGLDAGDGLVATVYGGAVIGEGVINLYGLFRPRRAAGGLLYMAAYKAASVLALSARLIELDGGPVGGWVVVGAWAIAGVWAAAAAPIALREAG